jgi:hypothetical protein
MEKLGDNTLRGSNPLQYLTTFTIRKAIHHIKWLMAFLIISALTFLLKWQENRW